MLRIAVLFVCLVLISSAPAARAGEVVVAMATHFVEVGKVVAAALKTLQALGIEADVGPKLTFAESVGQAFDMVATGSVEAGFVALSQVHQSNQDHVIPVPGDLHDPILQDAMCRLRLNR